MTNGQIQRFQELSKCYMVRGATSWVEGRLETAKWDAQDGTNTHLSDYEKFVLRLLTHRYRHQIAAMRKNRARQA